VTRRIARAEIGQWYSHTHSGELFRVVSLDEPSHMIETQSLDGDLNEFDLETWNTLPLTPCPDPENGSGPMDDVEMDDWSDMTGRSSSYRDVLAFLPGD
jgi:hypothetical protein